MAELDRTGALDRSLLVLVSPTGTGYVNYVAVAALQYLALGDVATVTMQYSRRPVTAVPRHGARGPGAEPAAVAADPPAAARPPRIAVPGWCCSARASAPTRARTCSCTGARSASTRWASTGRCGSGRRTAASGCARSPAATGWTSTGRPSPSSTTTRSSPPWPRQRGSRPRFVLLSHDNDGVTKFGPDLLWYPPDWLGPSRPRPEPVAGGSPRGIPPAMRWRPVTTFFQSLVDMKNAQTAGPFGREPARLPRGPAPLPQRRVRAARHRGAARPDRGDPPGARDRAGEDVRRRPRGASADADGSRAAPRVAAGRHGSSTARSSAWRSW